MEALKKFFEGDRFAKRADVELVSVFPGHATARMAIQPYHWNGLENVQGGAVFTLADFAFAAASNSHGNVAVAIVNAALRSVDQRGQLVRVADVLAEAQAGERTRHVA